MAKSRFGGRINIGPVAGNAPFFRFVNPAGSNRKARILSLAVSLGVNSAAADVDSVVDFALNHAKAELLPTVLTKPAPLKVGAGLIPLCRPSSTTNGGSTAALTPVTSTSWTVKIKSKEPYHLPKELDIELSPGTALDISASLDVQMFVAIAWEEEEEED